MNEKASREPWAILPLKRLSRPRLFRLAKTRGRELALSMQIDQDFDVGQRAMGDQCLKIGKTARFSCMKKAMGDQCLKIRKSARSSSLKNRPWATDAPNEGNQPDSLA